MGFTDKQARRALEKTDNNVDRAIDYLFNHPDDIEDEQAGAPAQEAKHFDVESQTARYRVVGSLLHLGSSVNSGHYVCYTRKGDHWIYFNDEKVYRIEDPPVGKGYLLFLERKD
eukprot:TRINITY_DN5228_c0_g1_i5.p1 TRINITY_DN5228_c0_g1~~TRINITY_DN5228_c0_g1_i5.p1  ORF type:complete len:114 (-),score=27.49 TRINITY_DN5228_c0_g1_i5:62-403(-)